MAVCRQPGCSRPASQYSVFCDEHHQQQLQNAEARSNLLRPSDIFRLLVGPRWLNALRIAAAGGAALAIGSRAQLIAVLLLMAAAFALAGWRWSHRIIWPSGLKIRYPVAFVPSRSFIIHIFIFSACLMGAVAAGVLYLRQYLKHQ